MSLPDDAIDKRPSIPMKLLRSSNALETFFQVIEWSLNEIRKS